MFICPICPNQYDSIVSLSMHYRRGHKKTSKDLYVALHHNGTEPTCKCGCGGPVKFLDITRGFSEFVWGHASRVNNNYQTEKSKTASLKVRREMLENGSWKPFALKETGETWNTGLTKETDSRVAKMSESITSNPEEVAKRSKRMKEEWTSGHISVLSREKHSQWKGGISSLNHASRAYPKLYKEWKRPKLVAAEFKCQNCFSQMHLEVHHDKETYSSILRKIAKQFNWEETLATHVDPANSSLVDLKFEICEAIANYHITNNVSGIVLCDSCHKLRHDKHNL